MPFALTGPTADDTDGRLSAVNRESMPRISIGDCSLYYERHGMGFPILFVSGLGGFASFWQDQIAAFGKRFEVVTFDHRGIGQSDQARIGYTVERMAADVVSLMDALRIKRAHEADNISRHPLDGVPDPGLIALPDAAMIERNDLEPLSESRDLVLPKGCEPA